MQNGYWGERKSGVNAKDNRTAMKGGSMEIMRSIGLEGWFESDVKCFFMILFSKGFCVFNQKLNDFPMIKKQILQN